jgi:hypothetical protein
MTKMDEIYLAAEVIQETSKAWLVRMEDNREEWLPKSACERDDNEFIIPLWLAEKKGLV